MMLAFFLSSALFYGSTQLRSQRYVTSQRTNSSCFTTPDYDEYCVLEDVCVTRGGLLVSTALTTLKSDGHEISRLSNLPTVDMSKFHQLPLRAYVDVKVDPVTFARALNKNHTSNLFVIAPDDKRGANPFHFAQSAMFFFHSALRTPENSDSSSVVIIFRQRPPAQSWIDSLTQQIFGDVRVVYGDELTSPICARRVVVAGTMIGLLQGPYDAQLFRDRVYGNLKINPKRINRADLRVTLIDRKKRRVTNVGELQEILDERRLWYKTVRLDTLSFKEQVSLMSETDLLISSHGADLTNVIFMQRESAVIELFPSTVWYYELYAKIARNAGLFHTYALGDQTHAVTKTIAECFESACLTELKRDFMIPPERFRTSLDHALSLLGVANAV